MTKLREIWDRTIAKLRSRPHTEWIPLAVLLGVAVAVWGFVELADEVNEGDLESFDRAVLMSLRHANDPTQPIGPHWLAEAMRDITALGSVSVLGGMTLAACGYLWLQGKHWVVLYVLAAVLGATAVSFGLKAFYDRPRPDLFPHGNEVFSASFPSGHSTMSAATYLTLGVLLARYQSKRSLRIYIVVVAVAMAMLVGFSRMYLSVHWPTDVLAGWTLGAAWALACWAVAAMLERRGMIEQPAE
jgi:undecaprenyl-diphosphatase